MDQFNRNNYKKDSIFHEFIHSCLGKIVIMGIMALILLVIAIMSVPSDEVMKAEMEDNIRQCLQANDSIRGDIIDDVVNNTSHIFTVADSTIDDREIWKTYKKHNELRIYHHAFYSTALIHNNLRPNGIRVGLGIFGIVIPTVYYSDLLLRTGAIRREFNQKLLQDAPPSDAYVGENPELEPYHYKGNPDD